MQDINFISFLFDINFIFTSRDMESWNVSATLSIFQIRQIRKTQRAQLYSEISFLLRMKIALAFVRKFIQFRLEKAMQSLYERIKIQDFSQVPCRNLELPETMKREIMLKSESHGYEGCV